MPDLFDYLNNLKTVPPKEIKEVKILYIKDSMYEYKIDALEVWEDELRDVKFDF